MTPGAPRRHLCSFCNRELREVGVLFCSDIGGMPAAICDHCVTGLALALYPPRAAEIAERLPRANGHDASADNPQAGGGA